MIRKKIPDLAINQENNLINTVIIANKIYSVKELNAIFSINSLMLVSSKEELLQYWQLAIETGIKKFIQNVDNVFNMRYPKYE